MFEGGWGQGDAYRLEMMLRIQRGHHHEKRLHLGWVMKRLPTSEDRVRVDALLIMSFSYLVYSCIHSFSLSRWAPFKAKRTNNYPVYSKDHNNVGRTITPITSLLGIKNKCISSEF